MNSTSLSSLRELVMTCVEESDSTDVIIRVCHKHHLLLSARKGRPSSRANTANGGSMWVLLSTALPLNVCVCALYN